MAQTYSYDELMPTEKDIEKIISAKLSYEIAQAKAPTDRDTWNAKNFTLTPWGIAYTCSKNKYEKSVANATKKGWAAPRQRTDDALKYFIIAVAIGWQELVDQLKRTIKLWGYTTADLQQMAQYVWQYGDSAEKIAKMIEQVQNNNSIKLTEAVEKHAKLNSKLFTKNELLKETVRKKMLEIVDEFLGNLKEQNIEIKVEDILLVGSNASYNYTKDSDIDLHVVANTKNIKYEPDIADALYSAYRTLFNKNLDISIYDIPLELYVETEKTPRNSNGVYSVKKDKWEKKPVQEEIPEYDIEALNKLVDKWEKKCKDLLDKIAADKLDDEKQVVKLIEDIYEKLRKAGVAKSEYAVENLAFKELRNKGYLDKLKSSKHELISKRLSLEEKLDRQARMDVYTQLTRAARTQPIIQDNGVFYIYNLKSSEIDRALRVIRNLPFVSEVQANESGKYDFSNPLELAMNRMPSKYYNIRGRIDETLI
jgi:predicted nucleotidyltransferase